MELVFYSEEVGPLKVRLDRRQKKLEVALQKNNMRYIERPWEDLFDKGKEDIQNRATKSLPDFLFKRLIIHHFSIYGFTLIKDM